jgi:kinesin light chain
MKESIKCLQETLDIREKHFGSSHPAVAATYNNLSVLHGKIGDFKTAEPYCKKALEIRQKFSNLAILCQHLGKYDEVEYYYQRALEIYQTELGPDDPNIAKTMNHLANCYLKQGKYRAAEATYKKVLDTVETRDIPGGPDRSPVHSAAWVMNASTESCSIKRNDSVCMTPGTPGGGWYKSTPVQSPTVSSTLRNLSNVYREQGQVDKANELDQLIQQKVLDKAQQDRVFQLLSEAESSTESSLASATRAGKSHQAFRAKRPSLSQSVRRLFRFKVDTTDTQDAPTSH